MGNPIVLDWPIVSLVAPIFMILAFYFPILVGSILVVRFLGNFGFIGMAVILSIVAEPLWLHLLFFDPFGKEVDRTVLAFGTLATMCIGLLIGCAFYLRLSPPGAK